MRVLSKIYHQLFFNTTWYSKFLSANILISFNHRSANYVWVACDVYSTFASSLSPYFYFLSFSNQHPPPLGHHSPSTAITITIGGETPSFCPWHLHPLSLSLFVCVCSVCVCVCVKFSQCLKLCLCVWEREIGERPLDYHEKANSELSEGQSVG